MPGPSTPPTHQQPRRSGVVGIVVTVASLAAVVGVAVLAAGSRDDGSRLGVPEIPADTLLDVAFATAVVYALVVVALLGRALYGERAGEPSGPTPRWFSMIAGMALMGGVIWFAFGRRPPTSIELDPIDIDFSPTTTAAPGYAAPVAGTPSVWVWFVAVVLVAAAVAIVWWTWRGTRLAPPDHLDADERLRHEQQSIADLLDDAIDDLRQHPDPRTAVIAAFARLEAGLALVGIRREVADTPLVYLRRVLERVEVSASAVEGLTEAYEEAKYSSHEITRSAQLGAVDALVAVRDELRVLSRRTPLGAAS